MQTNFLKLRVRRMGELFLFSFLLVQIDEATLKSFYLLRLLIDELSYCRYEKRDVLSEGEVELH